MFKVLLCFSLLLGNFSLQGDSGFVKKIEYNLRDNVDNKVLLKINLFSIREDVVEIRINFYDREMDCYPIYYSSSLMLKGDMQTVAKIPFEFTDKTYLNIAFYSSNKHEIFEEVLFPVYPRKNDICDFNIKNHCISDYPSVVVYENKNIYEKYDELFLISNDKEYYSFNNRLPIDKIKISSKLESFDGYAILYLEHQLSEWDLYYKEKYSIPLSIKVKNNIIKFGLENKYYLDIINGLVYENYHVGTVHLNELIFPYIDAKYSLRIELVDASIYYDKVIVDFVVLTNGALLGNRF